MLKAAFLVCALLGVALAGRISINSGDAVTDTCTAFCGSNNNCAQKHFCGMGCNTDKDCDPAGPTDFSHCGVCDVGMRTCRAARYTTPCQQSNFTMKAATQIMEDYKNFAGLPDLDTCLSKCCPDDQCSAVTWIKADWGTLCYLHNHTSKQTPNPNTTAYLRNDVFPPEDDTRCPRCDLMDGQCSKGYGCGCPCSLDSDCDNHGSPACSKCVGRTTTALGLCGGGPPAAAEQCIPPYPGQPHKNCSDMMDLIFLLDGSGSIQAPDWILIKQFTMQIGLNFSSAPVLMQYGIVQFSDDASTFLHLTPGNSSFQLVMNTMWKFDQSTNTGQGLNLVTKEFNDNGRPGAYKVVVVITDGMWNTGPDPIPIATALKNNGTHIYGIAVGGAEVQNVQALCSQPLTHYYYNVSTESQLPTILHDVINNMCWRDQVPAAFTPQLLTTRFFKKEEERNAKHK